MKALRVRLFLRTGLPDAVGVARAVRVVSAVVTLGVVAGCTHKWTCDFDGQLKQRAGNSSRDCGHASLDSDANDASVDDCVTLAFGKKEAFFAQYDQRGVDSKVVYGIASDGNGTVTVLQYDADPSGGSSEDPTIFASLCKTPTLDPSSPRDPGAPSPIQCVSLDVIGQTCGASQRQD
jgi:hypothetical protein